MEHGIAIEPMKGQWASSRTDLGYTELFCIPEVTAVFLSSCESYLGDHLVVASSTLRFLTCLIGNTELLCTQCKGFLPHLLIKGISHGISRVAAGTWSIFTSYSGDGHANHHIVQRSQDSSLVSMDNSGI